MVNELQTKLDSILLDKNTNLLPENLKKDVTCLGITGTLPSAENILDVTSADTITIEDNVLVIN